MQNAASSTIIHSSGSRLDVAPPIVQPPLPTSADGSPLPLSATARTVGAASLVMLSVPADVPCAIGAKLTTTEHSVPAGRLKGTGGQDVLWIE